MVFRKDSKVDAFQRQISALRQQLGTDSDQREDDPPARNAGDAREPTPNPTTFPEPPFGTRAATDFSLTGAGSRGGTDPYLDLSSPAAPAIPVPPVDPQTSVVAHDTAWNGDLQSSGSLHIHGRVEGSLTAREDVYIAEEADVSATITATNVIIAGSVRGTVRCSSRFEVLPQGRVSGDVQAPTLVVHEGASINGQIRMGSGEASAAAPPAAPSVVHRRAARGGD